MLRPKHNRAIGTWRIASVFHTECAELVELHSHGILKDCLERVAPLGEVFSLYGG